MEKIVRNPNGTLSRAKINQSTISRFQQSVAKEKAKIKNEVAKRQYIAQLKENAKFLDSELQKVNSISEFKKYYSNIPAEIKQYMTINENTLQSKKQSQIQYFEQKLERYKNKYENASKKDDYEDEKYYRSLVTNYQKTLNELKTTDKVYSQEYLNKLTNYYNDLARYEYKRARAKKKRKEELKKAKQQLDEINKKLKTGYVSKITYSPDHKITQVTIDGKNYNLKKYNVSGDAIKFGKQSNINFSSSQRKLIDKYLSGQKVTVGELQKSGLSMKAISELGKISPTNTLKDNEIKSLVTNYANTKNRGPLLRDYIKKYGSDATTKIVELANLKKMSEKDLANLRDTITKALYTKDGKRKQNITVDKATLSAVYKKQVNDELRQNFIKPLSYTESVKKFDEEYNRLQTLKKEFKTPVLANVTEQNRKKLFSAVEKLRTGQSMTPDEIKLANKAMAKSAELLEKQQLHNAKQLVFAPYIYKKNLEARRKAGEKNPLYNDLKNVFKTITTTVYDDTKNTAVTIKNIGQKVLYDVPKGAILSAYNYGKRLANEAQKGNFVLDDDLKKLSNEIISGAKNLIEAEERVRKFIINNPGKAAVLAGAFAISVVDKGSDALIKGTTNVRQNPAKFVGHLLSFYVAGKAIDLTLKGPKAISRLNAALDKHIPTRDFYATKIGKGYEPHKGEYEQWLVTFKGDIVNKNGNKVGVIRVKTFDVKNPFTYLDKIKGKQPGTIKRVYKISDKQFVIKNVPSEFATKVDELKLAGKKQTLVHVTDDASFLEKAYKNNKMFNVLAKDSIEKLSGREAVGGIELGMFYAPNMIKNLKLKNGQIIPKGTPQAYVYYSGMNEASFYDLLRGEAKFSLFKPKKGMFIKQETVDLAKDKILKQHYVKLAQLLNEAPGTKLSASTLKGIRTELEAIDSQLTKNIITGKHKIRLTNGETFVVYTGKTKKLTKQELMDAYKRVVESKINRIKNVEKFIKKKPDTTPTGLAVIKTEIQNIQKLNSKLKDAKVAKAIEQLKKKYNIKSLKLSKAEKQFLEKLNKETKKIEAKLYSKKSKIYSTKTLVSDASKVISRLSNIFGKISTKSSKVSKVSKKVSTKSSKISKKLSKVSTKGSKVTSGGSSKVSTKGSKVTSGGSSKVSTKGSKVTSGGSKITSGSSSTGSPITPSKIIKLINLKTFKSSTVNSQVPVFNIRYREKKYVNRKTSKSNPVIVKTKQVQQPFALAFNTGAKLIDKSTSRSFDLVPVGLKKVKDGTLNKALYNKFRVRKTKTALHFVEKEKYAIDSKSEKTKLRRTKK